MKSMNIMADFVALLGWLAGTKVILEEAAKTDCKILKREANRLGKVIKKEIVKDRTEYCENKFN